MPSQNVSPPLGAQQAPAPCRNQRWQRIAAGFSLVIALVSVAAWLRDASGSAANSGLLINHFSTDQVAPGQGIGETMAWLPLILVSWLVAAVVAGRRAAQRSRLVCLAVSLVAILGMFSAVLCAQTLAEQSVGKPAAVVQSPAR
jgi:hypothetical protein